ncbi:MAG: toll/interleukin-1 receptor domain-containing protein [bacterium]
MTNPIPTTPKIFISHAWEDKAFVRQLEDELKAAGAEVWVDHSGVRGGDNLPKRISDALEWCDTVLLIWSEAAGQSHWVELEWTNGISLKKTIIPCLLSQVQLPGMLVNRLYVDFRNVDQGLAELLRALQLERSSQTKFSGISPHRQSGDRFPDTELKDRRIDSAVPSQAEVGQRIDLLVQVRFPDSPLLGREDWPTKTKPDHIEQTSESVPLEFPVDPRTGKLGPVRLEIQIIAPDFEIAGAARQRLLVPPEEYSKCLAFLITPKKTGVCRINVEIYNIEQIFLGAIPLETNIGGAPVAQALNVANLLLFVVVGQDRTATRVSELDDVDDALPLPAPAPKAQPKSSPREVEPEKKSDMEWQHDTAYAGGPQKNTGCLGRAVLGLGLLALLVTVLAFIFDLPQKLNGLFTPASSRLFGEVLDANNKGVESAQIEVRLQIDGPLIGSATTGSRGAFNFPIKAKNEETIYVTVTRGDSVGFANYLTNAGKQIIRFKSFKKK